MRKAVCLVLILLLAGCASKVKRQQAFIAQGFAQGVQKHIYIVPIIDTQTDIDETVKDIKDIESFETLQKLEVEDELIKKGYTPHVLAVDPRGCGSVAAIKHLSDINCDLDISEPDAETVLLLSIDSYTPPEILGIVASGVLSGVLYSRSADQVIWRDSIKFQSQGAGAGIGLAGFLLKAMAPGTYKGYLFPGFERLLESLPAYGQN